jgi:hypothetical protein
VTAMAAPVPRAGAARDLANRAAAAGIVRGCHARLAEREYCNNSEFSGTCANSTPSTNAVLEDGEVVRCTGLTIVRVRHHRARSRPHAPPLVLVAAAAETADSKIPVRARARRSLRSGHVSECGCSRINTGRLNRTR